MHLLRIIPIYKLDWLTAKYPLCTVIWGWIQKGSSFGVAVYCGASHYQSVGFLMSAF